MNRYQNAILMILLCFALVHQVQANDSRYCRKYIEEAARITGVLPEILWAVAKAESNYGSSGPWPWTLNVNGKGYYFPSREAAERFLKSIPKKAKFQTDVGCMQLNWGYHGKAFQHLTSMLNPRLNVIYAAFFLKDLFEEKKGWTKAVSSYHSRNWIHGGRYANRVVRLVQDYEKMLKSAR